MTRALIKLLLSLFFFLESSYDFLDLYNRKDYLESVFKCIFGLLKSLDVLVMPRELKGRKKFIKKLGK